MKPLLRLVRMSRHEMYTRLRQESGKRADVWLYRLGRDPFTPGACDFERRGPFFRDAAEVPDILDLLRRRMPEVVKEVEDRARRTAERKFDLLGYRSLDFGQDIEWSLDPVSGRRAPALPWPSVPYLDFGVVGDHKVVWEFGRHQFMANAAKAYRFTGDERFASVAKTLWYDWRDKNPYPIGIHWTSTLEVAFRAVSWMWTAFLLEGTPADDTAFQRDIACELGRAGWYIDRFLSTYFSPNTHLLGEGFALFLMGTRYPGLRRAAVWRKTGWDIVLEAARRQVNPDGFYFERSVYYHVYALDFFLHARAIAARSGMDVPKAFDATIRSMLDALARLGQAGALPRFGDDDGGRLFDPSRNRPEHMLDPLSHGSVLYREPGYKAAARELTGETLWLAGAASAAMFDSLTGEPKFAGSHTLKDSGVYVLAGDGSRAVVVDAGPRGRGSAGHSHADALSLQLAWNGRLWLADPGAGRYAGDDGARDRFRGTSAHNTVTVDGLSQAEPRTAFSWDKLPPVQVHRWVSQGRFDFLEASHTGYERLASPVVHRRWVVATRPGLWLVRDRIEGSGRHGLEVRWHFSPGIEVCPDDGCVWARWGDETLTITPVSGSIWKRSIAHSPYSPAYGTSVDAPVVCWSRETDCPAEFAVLIAVGEQTRNGASRSLVPGPDGVMSYEHTDPAGTVHRWFFAPGHGAWRQDRWSSDAAALCLAGNDALAVDGSFWESDA